jgi:hypothetical protein
MSNWNLLYSASLYATSFQCATQCYYIHMYIFKNLSLTCESVTALRLLQRLLVDYVSLHAPCTFAPTLRALVCVRAMSFLPLISKTLVYTHTLHFFPYFKSFCLCLCYEPFTLYSRDSHSYSHLVPLSLL